jgi:hypothetical protein
MPTVTLAAAIARWLSADPVSRNEVRVDVAAGTLRQALNSVFEQYPVLRGYVVDERGALRHHVVAYINNEPVRDKQNLSELVPADGEVYIFQALSGG